MIDADAHKTRILSSLTAGTLAGWVNSSWRRCVEVHGLDPVQRRRPQMLMRTEWRRQAEMLEPYRDIIEQGLFELYAFVDPSGYEVSFCSKSGVTILNLPSSASGAEPGLECPGSLWTEEAEGTNGVGTAIWEERAVSVYKTEHFLSRYVQNCCAAAPLLSASGEMLGVFNITTNAAAVSPELHQMAFNVLTRMVDKVEQRLFRHHYREHCLVEMRIAPGRLAMLATREEGSLIAADKHAITYLNRQGRGIDGQSLWNYFDKDSAFLMPGGPKPACLVHRGDGSRVPSKIRFPNRPPVHSVGPGTAVRDVPPAGTSLGEVAGCDPKMLRNMALLERVRDSTLPVLLLGETGTGKDVLARAIHADSPRARKPFVALNCAALPESLIDSELFGYGAGAFTGARKEGQAGRIVEANGGTLFLDEIGDMPAALQTRLLRFLENAEVAPVGGGAIRRVDVRVIAATNVSVIQATRDGRFRADLYYRLAGVVVNVPALRERADLEQIVTRILASNPSSIGASVSADAMAALRAHVWPGNIRELRNVLQRAACFAETGVIKPEHLFFDIENDVSVAMPDLAQALPCQAMAPPEDERAILIAALQAHQEDVLETSRSLNMSRATFYRRLKEFGIQPRGTRRIRIRAAV